MNKVLKSTMFIVLAIGLSAPLAVSANSVADDVLVSYMSSKNDKYADGTPVVGKECYALVWTKKTADFSGFNSNGTLIDTDNDWIFAVALLEPGEACVFDHTREEYTQLQKDWTMAVYILDTRGADGKPTGKNAQGMPNRVSRWGLAVDQSVVFSPKGIITDFPSVTAGSQANSEFSKEDASEPIAITEFHPEGDMLVATTWGGSETCTYAVKAGNSLNALAGEDDPQEGSGVKKFRSPIKAGEKAWFMTVYRVK